LVSPVFPHPQLLRLCLAGHHLFGLREDRVRAPALSGLLDGTRLPASPWLSLALRSSTRQNTEF